MTMPDRETVIANLREDIDLLTHDRQPTAEELRIVNDLSAAIALLDQEEIVRCKDCKHWDESDHDCNIKTGWFACGADWFCADGERGGRTMPEVHLQLADALHQGRALTMMQKEIRSQLNDYMDNMLLPEGTNGCQRLTIKIWSNHYMDGMCSFESLRNILMNMGLADLFTEPPHELEIDKNGNVKIYPKEG